MYLYGEREKEVYCLPPWVETYKLLHVRRDLHRLLWRHGYRAVCVMKKTELVVFFALFRVSCFLLLKCVMEELRKTSRL